MYDSISGRFMGRDPLGTVDGNSRYQIYISLQNMDPLGNAIVTGPFTHVPVSIKSKTSVLCHSDCDPTQPACEFTRIKGVRPLRLVWQDQIPPMLF